MWIKIIDVHLQAEWWLILRSLDESVMLLLFFDVIAHGIVWEADTVNHYDDVIMDAIASLITSLIIVYSTVYSDADQRKHQSSASLAFVWGIHRWPVHSPHKWPVTRKIFPFDDVTMWHVNHCNGSYLDCGWQLWPKMLPNSYNYHYTPRSTDIIEI